MAGGVVAAGDLDRDGPRRRAIERVTVSVSGHAGPRVSGSRLGLIQRVAPYPGARVECEIAVSADQRRRGRDLEAACPLSTS